MHKKHNIHYSIYSGFTLIELLVVLAIIALLASVIFASMGHIQKKSRDTRRMEDLSSLVKAIELYQTGRNRYPKSYPDATVLDGTDPVSTALIQDDAIAKIPLDPLAPDYVYSYKTNQIGTDFTISFCLETNAISGYTAGCDNTITP